MKQYIYIIIALTVSTISVAQETEVPLESQNSTERFGTDRKYFKDINNVLDKFIGTWKYETPTDTLEVTFYKVIHDINGIDSSDALYSNFIYIKNGIEIFNTFPMTTEDDVFIFGDYLKTLNKIQLMYSEPNSKREWSANLILDYVPALNAEPEKLNWFVETFSKKNVNGEMVYPFEIPNNLVLTKME